MTHAETCPACRREANYQAALADHRAALKGHDADQRRLRELHSDAAAPPIPTAPVRPVVSDGERMMCLEGRLAEQVAVTQDLSARIAKMEHYLPGLSINRPPARSEKA